MFRIQYQQVGRYAGAHAVIDLTPHLEQGYSSQFAPAFWQAVTFQGKQYALPHHTDTFALYYNLDFLHGIGVEMPTSLDHSLSWDEFIRVARQLKQKGDAPYAFAMAWQNSAAYRWLPFLYQHGGQMLDADLRQPQLASAKGVETIAWTQSWFKEGLVPPSTSVRSGEQTQNLFANGTIAMLLGGDWQIPFLQVQVGRHLHATQCGDGVGSGWQLLGRQPRQQASRDRGRLPKVCGKRGQYAGVRDQRAVSAGPHGAYEAAA
jgi:ABC-type glycerol-3-phosphate transport system substrate-binding protein